MLVSMPVSPCACQHACQDCAESRSNAKATFIGRGWIHENEEMRCGCETEKALYERHNVSFGVEGPNGMSSDVRGLVDYYWHVGDGFWVFGKSASIRLFVPLLDVLLTKRVGLLEVVGGGCNSDASSSCCKDFGCSIDGDYSPGCAPQGKGDCTAPICKAKGYTCSPGHGECCGFDRERSDGRGLGCDWCRL